MSPIFSLFFAASATAQITTSMWLPSPYSNKEMGFYGSVLGADGDRVTLALVYDNETNTNALGIYDNTPETVTFAGTTAFEAAVTTTEVLDDSEITISLGCTMRGRNRARPTCRYSSNGAAVWSSYCSDYASYTDIFTTTEEYYYYTDATGPATVMTTVQTYDYRDEIPDYCLSGSTLPDSLVVETMTLNRNYVETYQIIITAGEEKLPATEGATPSTSGASATSTVDATATGPTSAQPLQSGSSSSSPTGSAASAPAETGAAAPMITFAPALAGLGAAVAALVL